MNQEIGVAWLSGREKRAWDIGIATFFTPSAFGLGGLAALAIAIEMRRKPWFTQDRVGKSADILLPVTKLVTLRGPITAEISANNHSNPRASMIGKYIRKAHIDEAPQLKPVIWGQMSIVGPRPIVVQEHAEIMDILNCSEQGRYLRARAVCKPGIVTPDSHLQHVDGSEVSLYDKAMNVVEYSETASRSVDISLLRSVVTSVIGDYVGRSA